jgi:hypothetical protein
MTVLIGASVLLIAGSAVALVFGWTGADQTLIWTSIAATAAAAVTLALAYFRSRNEPAPSEGPVSTAAAEPAAQSTPAATEAAPEQAAPAEPEAKAEAAEPEPEPDAGAVAADEPPPTQEVPAAAPPRSKPTVRKMEVVAIASTKKFHRPDCRYSSSSGAEKMSKGEARKQGFAPCGVCKP